MEVFKTLGRDLSGVGFVLEGNQVRTALNRAILTGMMFFVKQLQPTKVFKTAESMAAWIRPLVHADDPRFEADLTTALEHLRSAISTSPML
jgi:hypothetical protein